MTSSSSTKVNIFFAIILIVLALAIRLWTSHKSDDILGPLMMRTGPDQTVYIPCDDKLYLYGHDGGLVDMLPLSGFGIDRYIDDFWVYGNGELLLRKEVSSRSFAARVVETFKTPGARMLDRIIANESVMQRCRLEGFACRTLLYGGEILDSLGIFRLFADEATDSLYVSDNLGRELLLLDMEGKLVRKSGRSFAYPNQLTLGNDGLLYVADTENHRIAAIRPDYKEFGTIKREFNVAGKVGKIYPTALAQTPPGEWWVVAAGVSMQKGALMIYGTDGTFIRSVSLPKGADPHSLVVLEDRVIVSDPTLMRIYSIGFDGNLQDDFGSDTLFLHLSNLKGRKQFYSSVSSYALGFLITGLAIAVAVLAVLRLRAVPTAGRGSEMRALGPISAKYDYEHILGTFKTVSVAMMVLLALLFTMILLLPAPKSKPIRQMAIVTLLMPAALYIGYYQLKNSSIEITENGITYTRGARKIFSPWQDVKKVSPLGQGYRIVTAHGTIPVGQVSPAGAEPEGSFWSLGKGRTKYADKLIEEVRKRAPHAE